jgi:hypothetical protein
MSSTILPGALAIHQLNLQKEAKTKMNMTIREVAFLYHHNVVEDSS